MLRGVPVTATRAPADGAATAATASVLSQAQTATPATPATPATRLQALASKAMLESNELPSLLTSGTSPLETMNPFYTPGLFRASASMKCLGMVDVRTRQGKLPAAVVDSENEMFVVIVTNDFAKAENDVFFENSTQLAVMGDCNVKRMLYMEVLTSKAAEVFTDVSMPPTPIPTNSFALVSNRFVPLCFEYPDLNFMSEHVKATFEMILGEAGDVFSSSNSFPLIKPTITVVLQRLCPCLQFPLSNFRRFHKAPVALLKAMCASGFRTPPVSSNTPVSSLINQHIRPSKPIYLVDSTKELMPSGLKMVRFSQDAKDDTFLRRLTYLLLSRDEECAVMDGATSTMKTTLEELFDYGLWVEELRSVATFFHPNPNFVIKTGHSSRTFLVTDNVACEMSLDEAHRLLARHGNIIGIDVSKKVMFRGFFKTGAPICYGISDVVLSRLLPSPAEPYQPTSEAMLATMQRITDLVDEKEDGAEEPAVPAPAVPPAPPVPPPTPPPKAAGGKRKRDGLPTGIFKARKQFRMFTRDVVTSKQTSHQFKTLAQAVAAKAAERAKWDEHKRQLAAQPQAKKRKRDLEVYGNTLKLERAFATALHAADEKIETMNDAVLTDSCGFFYDEPELALGIQLKATPKPMEGNDNTWHFNKVNHYPGLLVVCWRADTQDGWIYDGNDLVERKSRDLDVVPGGINAKLAINTDSKHTRAKPLPIEGLVARIRELAADCERFPPHTKAYWSWRFSGKKAHKNLTERISLHLEALRDPGATFPEAQAGSFDQLGGDGRTRRQLKTGCVKAGHKGWHVHLQKSAGMVDGKRTYRPYAAGAFDELVVYVFDWSTKTARVWRIPASKLVSKGYLRTDTETGKKYLYVYEFAERQSNLGPAPDTWTAAYYEGTVPLVLPPEAEAAAGHLLDDLRSGRVA